jgi:hypothetical protein
LTRSGPATTASPYGTGRSPDARTGFRSLLPDRRFALDLHSVAGRQCHYQCRFHPVLSIGYNGNAKGLRNTCDRREPGNCGCIHSEINALLKLDYTEPHKIMFVTDSPCEACAKAMINAGISRVYYLRQYRRTEGVELLRSVDIPTELLTLPESLI